MLIYTGKYKNTNSIMTFQGGIAGINPFVLQCDKLNRWIVWQSKFSLFKKGEKVIHAITPKLSTAETDNQGKCTRSKVVSIYLL